MRLPFRDQTRTAPAGHSASPAPADPYRYATLLIAVAALGLRIWGIGWGAPNATRYFSYHPDESMVLGAALRLDPFHGQLDPGLYNYGSLALLLDSVLLRVGMAAGFIGQGPIAGVAAADAVLAARLLTACLGAGTCLFLYATARRLYGAAGGIAAALFYAVAPLAVQHAHFATVDVPATFFVSGALYFAVRHLEPSSCRPRDLLWCGLWAGLAGATKYTAALALLVGAMAWWLAPGRRGRDIALLIGAAAGGFLAGCPAAVLNPTGTLGGILYESVHAREGHGSVFVDTPPALIYHLTFNLRWGLGWGFLGASVAAVAYAVLRRRPGDLLALAFLLPYYLLIGLAQVKFARYTLPLMPPLALLVGGLLPATKADARSGKRSDAAVRLALALAAVPSLLLSMGLDQVMTGTDPRDAAADFLRGSGVQTVEFATGPWFDSPPLGPLLCAPRPDIAQRSAFESPGPPRLIPAMFPDPSHPGQIAPDEWDASLLRQYSPDAVPLSELGEYADAERIHLPAEKTYLAALRAQCPNEHVFARPVTLLGIPFTGLSTANGLPTQNLPHDMLYTNPTMVVFTR